VRGGGRGGWGGGVGWGGGRWREEREGGSFYSLCVFLIFFFFIALAQPIRARRGPMRPRQSPSCASRGGPSARSVFSTASCSMPIASGWRRMVGGRSSTHAPRIARCRLPWPPSVNRSDGFAVRQRGETADWRVERFDLACCPKSGAGGVADTSFVPPPNGLEDRVRGGVVELWSNRHAGE